MIPDWNMSGAIPPVRPGVSGGSADRSPYKVKLEDIIDRFGTTPERLAILDGLLLFRAELQAVGLNQGFQWLDGSFMEEIEALESRPPADIDIVTFFSLPFGETQQTLANKSPDLFDQSALKMKFSVDGYFCVLGESLNQGKVQSIAYWYSMWSHRRDGLWKGFVQVDLSPGEDVSAKNALEQIKLRGSLS